MAVPYRVKKTNPLQATQVWLQIYSHVLESLVGTVDDVKTAHNIAASAANAIIKEVELGDPA
jgi:hypothetical protein